MKHLHYFFLIGFVVLVSACTPAYPPLPDNNINFSSTQIGFDENTSSKTISIQLDRSLNENLSIVISLQSTGVKYNNHYLTTPEVNNNSIELSIPAGQVSATIEIEKLPEALFEGTELIVFEIQSISNNNIIIGERNVLSMSFSSIVSQGSSLTLNGGEGGSMAANSVYVDLSNNEQTAVSRKSWNLGFYCGNEFAVILNNTTGSTAIEADVAIDAIVSAENYQTSLTLTASAEGWNIIDDWAGDLNKTVIKEGKVYIVNLGESQTPLYKIKISSKNPTTYTLQYAKINESNVQSVDIFKNSQYDFVYFSLFDNNIVQVAPEKSKWDIMWTRGIYQTLSGGVSVPYTFSDLIMINTKNGVQAIELLTANISYADFSLSDCQSVTFNSNMDVIGSKWRIGGGPNAQPAVRTDRFYLIKDVAGNIYKLQFVSMGPGDGGTRGYPQIRYELLQ
jgi:hypothetical protein